MVRKDRRAEQGSMSRAMRGRALPYQCHARLHVNSLAHPDPRPDGQIRKKETTTPAPQLAVPKNPRFFSAPFPLDGRGAGTRGDVSGVRRREISGTSAAGWSVPRLTGGPPVPFSVVSPLQVAGSLPSQCLKRLGCWARWMDVGQYSCAVTSAGPQGEPYTWGGTHAYGDGDGRRMQ